jgi:ribose 5-phosphate isomerase A
MSDDLKRLAALEAVKEVQNGMIVGLGTGSTASHFIRGLGERVRSGLRITAIPTSEASARLAFEVGVALTTFTDNPVIDLTVDGADEVSPDLDLIKGLGGALVREKVVARASKRVVIVVDEAKLVDSLGLRTAIPVEVVPFSADVVIRQLEKWGGRALIRQRGVSAFVSDNGNTVIDWAHGVIDDPLEMERRLKSITGVVDSGIFAGVADSVIAAGPAGIRRLDRKGKSQPWPTP